MSNRTYDILKTVQKIFVLLATFYTTIANVWGLSYGEEISKTFLACATFLLGILELSTVAYKQKQLEAIDIQAELEDDDTEEVEGGIG